MASFRSGSLTIITVLGLLSSLLVGLSLRQWPESRCKHIGLGVQKVGKTRPDTKHLCPTRERGFKNSDLMEKGFAIVPQMLTPDEVRQYHAMWKGKADNNNFVRNYGGGVRSMSRSELKPIFKKLHDVMIESQTNTDIYVAGQFMADKMTCFDDESAEAARVTGQFFHTSNIENESQASLLWHQDTELGYMFPGSYNIIEP